MSVTSPSPRNGTGRPPAGIRPADAPASANLVAQNVARQPATVRKHVRVRKARRSGACPVCRRYVLVGDLIASVGGAPFMCAGHVTREDTT